MLIPLGSVRPLDRRFKAPVITTFLILSNIAVFIYQYYYLKHNFVNLVSIYGAIPYELIYFKDIEPTSPIPIHVNILISLFLHGGLSHIVFNMLYLFAFGPHIEDAMGHIKFLIFYLMCGDIATLCFVIMNVTSESPLIGASGAIAGIMGAHLIAFPGARIKCLLLIFIVRLPAIIVLLPWFAIQIMNVVTGEQQSSIAWLAHLGGFVVGMLFVRKFQRRWIFKRET